MDNEKQAEASSALNNEAPNGAEKEKHNYKISEEEFLDILEENDSRFLTTAKAIREKYGISYTRQAVHDRLMRINKNRKWHEEKMKELAAKTIFDALEQDEDRKLKYRAAVWVRREMGEADIKTGRENSQNFLDMQHNKDEL